eukprot:4769396-Pleurochrysis_carterae.AAC.1
MEAKKEAAEERAAMLKAQESNAVARLGCFNDGVSAEMSARPCPPPPPLFETDAERRARFVAK